MVDLRLSSCISSLSPSSKQFPVLVIPHLLPLQQTKNHPKTVKMLVTYSTLAVVMASMAIGAPLNINLGAYSPALVVGDGEISFAGNGAAGAGNIMNTLQGAAASSAGAVAQGQAIAPATPAAGTAAAAPAAPAAPAAQVQGLQRSALLNEPVSLLLSSSRPVSWRQTNTSDNWLTWMCSTGWSPHPRCDKVSRVPRRGGRRGG